MKLASRQDGLYVSTDNKLSNAQQEQAARGILRHLRPGDAADQQLAEFLNLGTLAVMTATAAAAASGFAANQPSAATPVAPASTSRSGSTSGLARGPSTGSSTGSIPSSIDTAPVTPPQPLQGTHDGN